MVVRPVDRGVNAFDIGIEDGDLEGVDFIGEGCMIKLDRRRG